MPNRVVLVTGPSGAGKTVTAETFAATRQSPTALLDQDLVRTFVKSGFARPDVEWGPEAERQWLLSRSICLDAIGRYLDEGFDCVIDVYAPGPDELWRGPVRKRGARFDTVVLRPSHEIAAARNQIRSDHEPTDAAAHRRNYETFGGQAPVPGAVLIDNTSMSVVEVVRAIEHLLNWS